jgi:hypothetical protein
MSLQYLSKSRRLAVDASFPNPGFGMDEKVIDRQQPAVNDDRGVDIHPESLVRRNVWKPLQEWDDQDQIISQKTGQLTRRIVQLGLFVRCQQEQYGSKNGLGETYTREH